MPYMTRVPYWELIKWRPEAVHRFGGILQMRISPGVYVECRRLRPQGPILDVGAGKDKFLQRFLGLGDDTYFSLDSDEEGGHQFRSFDDIPADMNFDLIVMNQVLEHVTVDDAYDMLSSAAAHLSAGARVIVSVPNAAHPTRFFSNVTHVTNWNHCDLYGLFRLMGLEVEALMRSNKRPRTRNPIRRWLINAICRDFRIDWCDSLILIARKP